MVRKKTEKEVKKQKKEEKEEREKPVWLKRSKEEIEEIIKKLAKQGMEPAKIGLVLRDSYGIPSVRLVTEKISKVLKTDKEKQLPYDLKNLIEKALAIKKHITKSRQDKVAKRGLQLAESKINKLARYYKKKGLLPPKWKYR